MVRPKDDTFFFGEGHMNAQHWEIFADLLERISLMNDDWRDTRREMLARLSECSSTGEWETIVSWFSEEADAKYLSWREKKGI